MIGGIIRFDQVMDDWRISAQVYEALDPFHREWLGGQGITLPMLESELSQDPLGAILSVLQRWLELTSPAGPR